uniref:Integrase core domain containing protein n=1 Tax=Solanum tuberosum TaxID=4113 RepID=M1DUS9_SOLTU
MDTMLQHMRPRMQRSMEEFEARMERIMDVKIQAVCKRLDAFELRVLESPCPTIEVTTFQIELTRLRSYVDALLAFVETVPEPTPEDEVDEVVMTTLFGDTMPPPDPSREPGKSTRSSEQTSAVKEARQAKKREKQQIEAA